MEHFGLVFLLLQIKIVIIPKKKKKLTLEHILFLNYYPKKNDTIFKIYHILLCYPPAPDPICGTASSENKKL